jgi:hypothetical protein
MYEVRADAQARQNRLTWLDPTVRWKELRQLSVSTRGAPHTGAGVGGSLTLICLRYLGEFSTQTEQRQFLRAARRIPEREWGFTHRANR